MIEQGKEVSIEYSVFLEDGTQVDTNVGKEPLIFKHGSKQILPALEDALMGLSEGETKRVKLPPDKAYGNVDPSALKEVNADLIPQDLRYVGALLVIPDEQGDVLIRVQKLEGDKAMLDFNHPLAGQMLTFDIKVLKVA